MAEKDGRQNPVPGDKWCWYEKSALSNCLRHDTWHWQLALPLICNIDMRNSGRSAAWYGNMFADPQLVETLFYEDFDHVALLSEDSIYQLTPIKTPTNADLAHNMRRLAALKMDSGRDDVEFQTEDIRVRMSKRYRACTELRQARNIFMSKPGHIATDAFEPTYFLRWAASKGIDIPWLEWATSRGLVNSRQSKPPVGKAKKEPRSSKTDQVSELREAAVQMAIRRVNDGMGKKYITVKKICVWLLESGKFSTGESFYVRWRTPEGIRRFLKGKDNPLSDKRYLDAKPIRSPKFNP